MGNQFFFSLRAKALLLCFGLVFLFQNCGEIRIQRGQVGPVGNTGLPSASLPATPTVEQPVCEKKSASVASIGITGLASNQRYNNYESAVLPVKDKLILISQYEYGPNPFDATRMQAKRKIKIFTPSTNQTFDISFSGTKWEKGLSTGDACFISDAVSDHVNFAYIYVRCLDPVASQNTAALYQINYSGQVSKVLDFQNATTNMGITGNSGEMSIDENNNLLMRSMLYQAPAGVTMQVKKLVGNLLVDQGPQYSETALANKSITSYFYTNSANIIFYFINDGNFTYSVNTSTGEKIKLGAPAQIFMPTNGIKLDRIFTYNLNMVYGSQPHAEPHDLYSYSMDGLYSEKKLPAVNLNPLYYQSYFISHSKIIVTQTPTIPQSSNTATFLSYDLGNTFHKIDGIVVGEFSPNSLAINSENRMFYLSSPDYYNTSLDQVTEEIREIVCR